MREIIIDGSEGEGGGQVLRTSLSLSAITGKPVRIKSVRGKRKKPGLFRQHLTAFKAAAEICDATMEGAELGSLEIAFNPGKIKGGDYDFSIGSAGATNLVAQTVLPILVHAPTESTVRITGGTHNQWAPTFEFLNQAFLPQFRKMGGRASLELGAYGFYPAGGGSITMTVKPIQEPKALVLKDRGERIGESVIAVLANLKDDIANREIKTLLKALSLKPEQGEILHVEGPGPGNAVTLCLEHEDVTEVFIGLGEHGVRAEAVAKSVAAQAKNYILAKDGLGSIQTAVGEHLADQLLLPMALFEGGIFTTTDISQHTRTNIEIIKMFLEVDVKVTQLGRKCWKVEVKK